MREVKFRGKSKITGEWVVGTYIDGYIIRGVVEANSEYIATENWEPVYPESVGECTGLKDKNGVGIYEGDITLNDIAGEFMGEVIFHEGRFTIRDSEDKKHLWILSVKTLVIGNIYENPELIK